MRDTRDEKVSADILYEKLRANPLYSKLSMDSDYEKLTLANDFVFGKVMRNPRLCKPFLEFILEQPIARIEYPEYQKTIDLSADAKGVRLDVYVEDAEHTVYDVEMQTTRERELPRRSRYYQGMLDLNLIEKGKSYHSLKKSYVIFICTFDPFGLGRYKYTFENLCLEEPELHLGDEAYRIFLNTRGTTGAVSDELKEIFRYLNGMDSSADSPYLTDLRREVERATQNQEWRREYMTLQLREMERYEQGRQEGRQEGRMQGRAAGIQLTKNVYRLAAKGADVAKIAAELEISEAEVREILEW